MTKRYLISRAEALEFETIADAEREVRRRALREPGAEFVIAEGRYVGVVRPEDVVVEPIGQARTRGRAIVSSIVDVTESSGLDEANATALAGIEGFVFAGGGR